MTTKPMTMPTAAAVMPMPMPTVTTVVAVVTAALLVAGCATRLPTVTTPTTTTTTPTPPTIPAGGGYYLDDRPPSEWPVDPDAVADAVPRHAPLAATGNAPYTALGKRYRPLTDAAGFVQRGRASWYGKKFHGRRTSSGDTYDMFAMTAAHPTLPLPSWVRVTNLADGRAVVVKVNDRGPFLHRRIIDLSFVAAHKLGIAAAGTGWVEVRVVTPAVVGDAVGDADGDAADGDAAGTMLQVGAYAVADNARAMRRRLQRAGFPVAPLAHADDLYRVRVGPFASADAADAARRRLEALLGRPVAVVQE